MKANLVWSAGESFAFTGSGDNPEDGVAQSLDGKMLDRNPRNIPSTLASAVMVLRSLAIISNSHVRFQRCAITLLSPKLPRNQKALLDGMWLVTPQKLRWW